MANSEKGDIMSKQKPLLDWNGRPIQPPQQETGNPMIVAHGPYSDARVRCRSCKQLVQLEAKKTIFKCLLRGVTGKKTDHRSRDHACSKFEARTEGHIAVYRK